MVITLEGKRAGRFYLAWKLLSAASQMLLHGTVEIELRTSSETPNVAANRRGEAASVLSRGLGKHLVSRLILIINDPFFD